MNKPLFLALILFLTLASCEKSNLSAVGQSNTTIPSIQGCSHQSPYLGQKVNDVEGIVTTKSYNGFYMQSEIPDSLACTSDAIFVFTDNFPGVIPGDKVLVSGRVEEFRPGEIEDRNLTITEIIDAEVTTLSSGNQLPSAVILGKNALELPAQTIDNDRISKFDPDEDGLDFYESLESMLVLVPEGVVVGPRNSYNEVVVIPPDYLDKNQISELGALVQRENDANAERILVNLNSINKDKVSVGSRLLNEIVGVMDYSYGNYKIKAFGRVNFSQHTPDQSQYDKNADFITLATYNVENLSRQDENSKFRRIASDIVDELDSPEIVVINEVMDDSGVEDDGTVMAIQTINRLINTIEQEGGPRYSYAGVDPVNNADGGIPGGNIRTVILFREDSGIKQLDDDSNSMFKMNPMTIATSDWPFSVTRKPLLALFERDGTQFLVTGLHLTSRGLDSPLFGSVQPIERLEENKRISQAEFVNKFLEDFHRKYSEIPIIIAGDFNDDPWSETLAALRGNIFYDAGVLIDEDERYSYILDGNAIQLDHILISDLGFVRKFEILHLNSINDHTLQVSDHDPVLVELDFPLNN